MITEPDHWLGVEIRHLAALQAVAEEGTFGRAATRLGYTQSAISQQIATLERIVGERLVERPGGPRPVSPTEAGRLLLRHAAAIVSRLNAAQADLSAFSQGEVGALRVGTFQSVGARVVPELLRRFSTTWPRVEMTLVESNDDLQLLAAVERGDLDLAFVMLPVEDGPFETVELLRDPYVLLVAADSPLAGQEPGRLMREIDSLPLIGYRQCRSVVQVENTLRSLGHEPRVVFRSDNNGTVQGLVSSGLGSALVPLLAVDRNDERTVIVEMGDRVPPRLIALAWHRDRYQSAAAKSFVSTAREVCAELADETVPRAA